MLWSKSRMPNNPQAKGVVSNVADVFRGKAGFCLFDPRFRNPRLTNDNKVEFA